MKRNIENYDVYKCSMQLVKEIYSITATLPYFERSKGLVSQLNDSTASVIANLAEGSSRHSTREFVHFLDIARGSLAESKTQLGICLTVGYITKERYEELMPLYDRIGKLLYGLRRKVSDG